MSFQDKSIQCSDCGTTFTFSAEEQEFFQSRAILMSPSAAPHAARQGRQSDTEIVAPATGSDAKCIPQHVRSAV